MFGGIFIKLRPLTLNRVSILFKTRVKNALMHFSLGLRAFQLNSFTEQNIMCHQYGGHCDVTDSEPKIAVPFSASPPFILAHQQWRSQSCRANYLLTGKWPNILRVTYLCENKAIKISLIFRS